MRFCYVLAALVVSCLLPTLRGQAYPPVSNSSAYVNSLANCTSTLVQMVCNDDTCPTFDPTQTDVTAQCVLATNSISAFDAYQVYYAAQNDPCAVFQPPDWSIGLHVAAVFVVLIASSVGACIPILAKYHPGFDIDPYYIILGKCMGIGVVLSCGLVHMLQPASESLTSPCLPWEFNTGQPCTHAHAHSAARLLPPKHSSHRAPLLACAAPQTMSELASVSFSVPLLPALHELTVRDL